MPIRTVDNANLSPREKISKFSSFLLESGLAVKSVTRNANLQTTDFWVEQGDGISLLIHVIVKNISGGGWSWRPFVKRIQIKSYSAINLPPQSRNEITLLGGFALVDGEYVYAAWNIFAYMTQNTVRSCYIDAEGLIEGHDKGFSKTFYADNHVYISDSKHMKDLLRHFIDQNSLTKI